MEPETCTAAQGEEADKDQNVRDSPPTTGEKSDEGHQIFNAETIYWCKTTLALDYLQPAFVSIVKDELTILQEQIKMRFGRKLCVEATAKDIIPVNKSMAQFSHRCTAKPYECQTLIFIILQHTNDCVQSYEMLKGTDPQKWLTSPFEFVRLFLEDWLRCDIHDFPECDITVLCSLVKRCKPLAQMFAPTNIDKVRKVTNRTLRLARLNIDQLEMEKNIDVILDFLQHIKALATNALKNTEEITKAIDNIEKLRTGDVRLLPGMVVQLIQGWLSNARRQFANKHDIVNDLRQNIVYMENELARLTSGQEAATTIKKVEEPTFQAKIKKLTDENQKLTLKTVDMAKEQEELENQNEELRKRLQRESQRQLEIERQRQSEERRQIQLEEMRREHERKLTEAQRENQRQLETERHRQSEEMKQRQVDEMKRDVQLQLDVVRQKEIEYTRQRSFDRAMQLEENLLLEEVNTMQVDNKRETQKGKTMQVDNKRETQQGWSLGSALGAMVGGVMGIPGGPLGIAAGAFAGAAAGGVASDSLARQ